jgi:hypothetical protein
MRYGNWLGSEWGTLVLMCVVIAVALLGMGDGALRPALLVPLDHQDRRHRCVQCSM